MPDIRRLIEDKVVESLQAFPVVYIAGPRQSGKTTLVQRIANTRHPAQYVTFDDIQLRSSAQHDPIAFLRSFKGPVVLDEVQLVPELFRPLKIIIDENRQQPSGGRGQFLLTGSASIMALPALSDALVGRIVLHTLLPLSALELQLQPKQTFIDRAFSDSWAFELTHPESLVDTMINASFPELLTIKTHALRHRWCNAYIDTLLQRDIRALMELEKIGVIPHLLQLIATRTGGLLNETSLSRDTDLNHVTAKKYRLLLEGLFLIQSVPAWSSNLGKRLIKAPKLYMGDLNLLSYLINTTLQDLSQENKTLYGRVVENYVAIELNKQLTFSNTQANLYHYRSTSGQEVDFILEGPRNHVICIEIKTKTKVTAQDFQQLESLKAELGKQFKRGFVLYSGHEVIPFGQDLWAVPLAIL